jgi:hypothetical protein
VANHQIRHLRGLLIDDSINFEKKYHFSRIKKHRYDCRGARKWYKSVRDSPEFTRIPMADSWPNKDVEAFVKAFVQLVLPTAARLPDTFILDNDRIRVLRAEIDEIIRENICCDVLKELVSGKGSTLSSDLQTAFRHRLQIIAGDVRISSWHMRAIDDISCEIVRFALPATGSTAKTDAELEDTAKDMLQTRLEALVRARSEMEQDAKDAEHRVGTDQYRQELFDELFPRVFRSVEDHLSSSPCKIFQAFVPSPAPPPLCPTPPTMRPTDRVEDLVRRIAHIAILHWRTWEHMVYNNEDLDCNAHGSSNNEYTSRASTPGPETPIKLSLTAPEPKIPSPWVEVDRTGEGCGTTKAPA